MSLSVNHLYEFGEFRLDVDEKTLTRDGDHLEITPKGFELLTIFLESQGKLLRKEDLMDKIWADSFVEESNLTFNIGQLRKLLGDEAHTPKYIRTVRGYGYRFIADVRIISRDDRARAQPEPIETEAAELTEPTVAVPNHRLPWILLAAVVSAVLVAGSGWLFIRNRRQTPPVITSPFLSEKLTNSGNSAFAAISPDAKFVVYTIGGSGDRGSLWLRHLDTGSVVEIIPPSDNRYYGLALSPDGTMLYFARRPLKLGEPMGIFRVSVFGGVPQKLATDTEGLIGISPDGKKISFVRCPHSDEDYCSLWIANTSDGSDARKIATRQRPFRIDDSRFAPDGRSVAFATGQSSNASNEFGLVSVDLETGVEKEITSEKFFNIKNLVYLPDGEMLVTASRVPTKAFRIWRISAKSAEPLTKDAESYTVLSVDRRGTAIVTTRTNQDFNLKISSLDDPTAGKGVAIASSARFGTDGRIYFQSIQSGNDEIWSMLPDGTGQMQLTNQETDETRPIPSNDGRFVFFSSNRTGAAQLWRMNPDGTDQKQMTNHDGGSPFGISPDDRWVFFRHGISGTLWKAPSEGGEPTQVASYPRTQFAVSPDATRAVVFDPESADDQYRLVDLSTGGTIETRKAPNPALRLRSATWLPDGTAYVLAVCEVETRNCSLWRQDLGGSQPVRIKTLDDLEINDLSVSPDGRLVAIAQGRWAHDVVLLEGLK